MGPRGLPPFSNSKILILILFSCNSFINIINACNDVINNAFFGPQQKCQRLIELENKVEVVIGSPQQRNAYKYDFWIINYPCFPECEDKSIIGCMPPFLVSLLLELTLYKPSTNSKQHWVSCTVLSNTEKYCFFSVKVEGNIIDMLQQTISLSFTIIRIGQIR